MLQLMKFNIHRIELGMGGLTGRFWHVIMAKDSQSQTIDGNSNGGRFNK